MNLRKSKRFRRQESVEVTPVGTQDGKEQRPAAIKSQPVPATTLRESHWGCMEAMDLPSMILGCWGLLRFVRLLCTTQFMYHYKLWIIMDYIIMDSCNFRPFACQVVVCHMGHL